MFVNDSDIVVVVIIIVGEVVLTLPKLLSGWLKRCPNAPLLKKRSYLTLFGLHVFVG